jgi:hypothetical protein
VAARPCPSPAALPRPSEDCEHLPANEALARPCSLPPLTSIASPKAPPFRALCTDLDPTRSELRGSRLAISVYLERAHRDVERIGHPEPQARNHGCSLGVGSETLQVAVIGNRQGERLPGAR